VFIKTIMILQVSWSRYSVWCFLYKCTWNSCYAFTGLPFRSCPKNLLSFNCAFAITCYTWICEEIWSGSIPDSTWLAQHALY